jgi:hypothetical protein
MGLPQSEREISQQARRALEWQKIWFFRRPEACPS